MEEEFVIRTVEHDTLPVLRELAIKTFEDTFREHNTAEDMALYREQNFGLSKLEMEWQEEGTVFFLAYTGTEAVGYAKVRKGEPLEALQFEVALEIERIYVHQDYLGRQVGKILLQACLHHARKAGYKTAWLGVWEHNTRAQAFYKKFGFERFSEHAFVLGGDAQTDWLMKKTL